MIRKSFDGEKMQELMGVYNTHKCITFYSSQLMDEELQKIKDMIANGSSNLDISKKLLVHLSILQDLNKDNVEKVEQETELIRLIARITDLDAKEITQIIAKDGQDLQNTLESIFKTDRV